MEELDIMPVEEDVFTDDLEDHETLWEAAFQQGVEQANDTYDWEEEEI